MGTKQTNTRVVGVWLPIPFGSHWRGEGIGRTIEFILEGFHARGGLGRDVTFVFFATSGIVDDIRSSIAKTLGPKHDGISYVEIPSPRCRAARFIHCLFSLNGRIILDRYRVKEPSQSYITSKPSRWTFRRKHADSRLAATLGISALREAVACNAGIPTTGWPDLRFDQTPLIDSSFRYEPRASLSTDNWSVFTAFLDADADARPSLAGVEVAAALYAAASRIPLVGWLVRAANRGFRRLLRVREQRAFLKAAMNPATSAGVDVWWVPSPTVPGVEFLQKPVVLNFWDFVGAEYGYLWGSNNLAPSFARLRIATHSAQSIITQSFHNKAARLVNSMRIPPEKVAVCYLTTPTHYRNLLPAFSRIGKKTPETKAEASDILHKYIARQRLRIYCHDLDRYTSQGLQLEILEGFDFSKQTFAVVSTQNRPYKNIPFLVDTFLWMLDQYGIDGFLFLTCPFEMDKKSDRIAAAIKRRKGVGRVFCLPRIPNRVHAALYHCATCTLHPSLSEGGVGSYPFLEGMALDTPGLAAAGEYMTEGLRLHEDYLSLTFSARSRPSAARSIAAVLSNPTEALARQTEIYRRHKDWNWTDVAAFYESIFNAAATRTKVAAPHDLTSCPCKEAFYDTGAALHSEPATIYTTQNTSPSLTHVNATNASHCCVTSQTTRSLPTIK
jgi:glycosyltransferase involved in cell wall biosynthesis